MDELAARILDLVQRRNYRPARLRALAQALGIPESEYRWFRASVKDLLKSGRLLHGPGKTLLSSEAGNQAALARLPGPGGSLRRDKGRKPPGESAAKGDQGVVGTFRRASRGFGFVRPDGVADRSEDIFIAARGGKDASTGDRVRVEIVEAGRGPRTNSEGRIVEVLERATTSFVGTYAEISGQGYVQVDGTTFSAPIWVGDPGAKGAAAGDKVTLELTVFPTPIRAGEGVITEVLGPRGQPGVDTLMVVRAFNLPDRFDDDVLEEARFTAKRFSETRLDGRSDLRGIPTVTIDPETAHDFDDAISLSRDAEGFWHLMVHIADVAFFVTPDSAVDRAARQRATSVYLPGLVIPMLPEVLSNSLASLQSNHVRYTVTAFLEFNHEGVRTNTRFERSAIRVDHRFSYEQAMRVMKADEEAELGLDPDLVALLKRMLELAMILRQRRLTRGSLELNMPEVELVLGPKREAIGAQVVVQDESHQVIEEFMLAANEAVAELLDGQEIPFLHRDHPDPDPRKLKDFAVFANSLGFSIEQAQSRFELQRVLKESANAPERHAVHYGLLRSLKQAVYAPRSDGHYALGAKHYCHFTSPIRRYPDLQVHRQLLAFLEGKKPRGGGDELAALAEHCTKLERRSEAAERDLKRIKLLTYLTTKIDQAFHAIIIGVEDFGLFCLLKEVPVEGLLHVDRLPDDHYYLEAETYTLIARRRGARYRLGNEIEVRIAQIDIDRRSLDLELSDGSRRLSQPRVVEPFAGRGSNSGARVVTRARPRGAIRAVAKSPPDHSPSGPFPDRKKSVKGGGKGKGKGKGKRKSKGK